MKKVIKRFILVFTIVGMLLNTCPVQAADQQTILLKKINDVRVANGLNKLKLDKSLTAGAQIRAQESSVSFSHTRPDGTECFTVSDKANGENLSYKYSVDEVVDKWMESPSHKENILYSTSTITGFGFYTDEQGRLYICELFD